ncbi:MAG: NAD(P)/FAD-dependent oxidoreductase [Dehalococcoidia bacterium]|nr:NAD(P)/FAD-dependent oxidoreductase [Dehalococcoidia bacterium]
MGDDATRAVGGPGANDSGDGTRPRVVIVGAGFGGLRAARVLRTAPVDVVLIDRHNYHTFAPLLYEVATAGLEPDDIAQPVRAILRAPHITFRMATVERIDLDRRYVETDAGDIAYDYLIIAAGSTTSFFGVRSAEERALGLKDLHEAAAVRNHLLRALEQATNTAGEAERRRLMTVVVVGGGPTGVELAGALAELKRHVLPRDYPELDLRQARVVLVEATDHLLGVMPRRLQRKAHEQLDEMGVEVRLSTAVSELSASGVVLDGGERIAAATVVWVAGVRGERVAESLGVDLGPGGRISVRPTLQLAGIPRAYAVGDIAYLADARGTPYPMLAQAAMQQGELAAQNIARDVRGDPPRRFRYHDRGTMATIGRQRAVAHVFGLQFSGFLAWLLWLGVHLVALVGFRNRALVLVNWAWNYFRYDRANRLVTDAPTERRAASAMRTREPSGEGEHSRASHEDGDG